LCPSQSLARQGFHDIDGGTPFVRPPWPIRRGTVHAVVIAPRQRRSRSFRSRCGVVSVLPDFDTVEGYPSISIRWPAALRLLTSSAALGRGIDDPTRPGASPHCGASASMVPGSDAISVSEPVGTAGGAPCHRDRAVRDFDGLCWLELHSPTASCSVVNGDRQERRLWCRGERPPTSANHMNPSPLVTNC